MTEFMLRQVGPHQNKLTVNETESVVSCSAHPMPRIVLLAIFMPVLKAWTSIPAFRNIRTSRRHTPIEARNVLGQVRRRNSGGLSSTKPSRQRNEASQVTAVMRSAFQFSLTYHVRYIASQYKEVKFSVGKDETG